MQKNPKLVLEFHQDSFLSDVEKELYLEDVLSVLSATELTATIKWDNHCGECGMQLDKPDDGKHNCPGYFR